MADLNKFQRSKERITEVLKYLTATTGTDHQTNPYVYTLQQSIVLIDNKIEELIASEPSGNQFTD
ncbi:hypothetical protein [Mucilaginibacter xinganensis]|uniref:Uncharacterized protein n=1 Tax=Mucilaginibacter xinganensis TaxID=1234841 RepID=A0A223NZW6_9SPHI|nr:hypothetical protein [Mucilaginibacter xinganensis]ASU35429.1 hypothetical protein MuYL_3544 [Mucilaginibacter xinganensis]